MTRTRDEFIHHANVENFRRRLRTETESGRRKVLLTLIEEEMVRGVKHGWLPPLD